MLSVRLGTLQPVKILVLGDSDSSGRHTGGLSWPEMLKESLTQKTGAEVELVSSAFSIVPATADEYAKGKMQDVEPDVVVLIIGTFTFTAGVTWLRVQQLFGKRAGRWYRSIEERFDSNTRDDAGKPGRMNVMARATVRRLIGTKTHTTRQKATEHYRRVFRVLSRFEDSAVVVMSYPGTGQHAKTGKGPELRRLFMADMRAAATEHHLPWVDGATAFAGHDASTLSLDDLHFSPSGHRIIADAVEGAVLETTKLA